MKKRRGPSKPSYVISGEQAGRFLAEMGAGMAPGSGLLEAGGQYYSPMQGQRLPGLLDNVSEGRYGTAALQGVGLLGDALQFAGPLGLAAGAIVKAPRAASRAAKVMQAGNAMGDASGVARGAQRSQSPLRYAIVKGGPLDGERYVPIRVIKDPNQRGMAFAVENGQAVLRTSPVFYTDKDFIRYRGFRALQESTWPLEPDVYVRTSSDPKDYDHLLKKTHHGSINHRTGEVEGGLSVARDTHSDAAGTYAYLVRGKSIGQGSDSEPLLDLSTVEVVSDKMPINDMARYLKAERKRKLTSLGLSEEDLRLIETTGVYEW